MVNVTDLDSARPSLGLSAVTDWRDLSTDLGRVSQQIESEVYAAIFLGSWSGTAAGTAQQRMQRMTKALEAAQGEVSAVSDVLEGLAEAMSVCQRELDEARQLATRYGLTIEADGTVTAYPGSPLEQAVKEFVAWAEGKQAPPQIAEVQELVRDALRRATKADQEAAAELRTLASHAEQSNPEKAYGDNTYSDGDGLAASRLELQMIGQSIPTGPPSLVSHWWAGLSSSEKTMLMEAAPGTIGTLAGIPASVQAQLRGTNGVNRVAIVNYALENTFNGRDDVDKDNCTNFASDALLAGGLQQKGNFFTDKALLGDNIDGNWYKTSVPDVHAGSSRSHSWGGASDLHQFLVHNGSKEVPYSQALPGDIAFFKDSKGIYHTAVVTAKVNGQIFYSQHTPGEQNASWGARQNSPDNTSSSIIIVQPGSDASPPPPPMPGTPYP